MLAYTYVNYCVNYNWYMYCSISLKENEKENEKWTRNRIEVIQPEAT